MKKVAVTGASGHLGANLVRQLIERGYGVRALVRQSERALQGLDLDIIRGDITDMTGLSSAFRGVDMVYHLAAHVSVLGGEWDKLHRVNVQGTQNVIEVCCAESVTTLVHFSSIHALEQTPLDQPVDENRPLVERRRGLGNDYDYSKALADKLVRQLDGHSLDTRIIYPTAVIGPLDFHGSLMGQVVQKLSHGRLPALVSGGFDWVDARDVAWAAIEAAEKGRNKDRFMLSGNYRNMRQVAAVVAELTGVPAPGFNIPIWLARMFTPLMGAWASLVGEPPLYTQGSLTALKANPRMSHALAADKLAYQPRDFRDTIRDALTFYSRQAQLKDSGHAI